MIKNENIEFYKKLRELWDDTDNVDANNGLVKKVTEAIANSQNILTEKMIEEAIQELIKNKY